MQQQQLTQFILSILACKGEFTNNSSATLQYQQDPIKNSNIPFLDLQCSNDYYLVLKFKLISGVDQKQADSEFKQICKSVYVLMTSFNKTMRDLLKPTFAISYTVQGQYAYVSLKYAKDDEGLEFLGMCRAIHETLQKSQEREQVSITLQSDISMVGLAENINNAIKNANISLLAKGQLSKQTTSIIEGLASLNLSEYPKYKLLRDALMMAQLINNAHIQVEFDPLEIDLKLEQPKLELPMKLPIYQKIKKFSECCDNQIELEFYCPYFQFNGVIQYYIIDQLMNIYKGIRILDLSRILVGPYATMMLSDYGAEVIKIESFDGDETRNWGPPYLDGISTYFLSINRNKKSICVDLKKGRDFIYDLSKHCDVVIENFSTGVTQKLGLDYENMIKVNPRLVYCSINGFGHAGTQIHEPGFDLIAQAESGIMHITGESDRQPIKVGVAIVDILTALHACSGIQAALYQRQNTGIGSLVQTSLYESAIASLVNVSSMYLNGNKDMKRMGNMHPSISPYGVYQINGDYVVIGAAQDSQFRSLCNVLNIQHLINDVRFITNKDRVVNGTELTNILNQALQGWDTHEFIRQLKQQKVPVGRVQSVGQGLESTQSQALQMVQQVGNEKMVRSPLSFNQQYLLNLNNAPTLNQHRDDVCQLMGINDIQLLIKQGILK